MLVRWEKKPIPDPRFGQQMRRLRGLRFDFLPELIHNDAQMVDLITVIRTPDRLEQLAMRNDFVGMRDQISQQIEFLGRETHLRIARLPMGSPPRRMAVTTAPEASVTGTACRTTSRSFSSIRGSSMGPPLHIEAKARQHRYCRGFDDPSLRGDDQDRHEVAQGDRRRIG